MNDKIERTSRVSQEKKPLRNKPWTPPSSLDAPPAPKGFKHRWIRTEFMGQEDTGNVSKKLREGWEFVRSEEIKNQLGDHDYPIIQSGRFKGLIGVGGLVLARIPEEIALQIDAYYKKQNEAKEEAVDNDLLKEQHPSMKFQKESNTRVTFGGTKKS